MARGTCGRQRDGGDQFAGGQRRAPLVLGQQKWRYRNGFGDRSGYTPAAQPFERDDQVDRVRVDAVEPLRHRQRGDAQVGQPRPDLAAGAGVAGCPGAHRTRQVGSRQRRVDACGEVALLFVKIESHLDFSRGSPSSRSAMMLR